MRVYKARVLCFTAIALTISACGGSSGSGGEDVTTPVIPLENTVVDTVAVGMETSDGFATPVPSVSSAQMDAYINNALLTVIPSELTDGAFSSASNSFIRNPLMN